MVNPILHKTRYLRNYIILWALIIVAHILVLNVFYEVKVTIAVVDGLMFNALFGGLGLMYWYPVKYSNIDAQNFITIIINHFAAALIAVGGWLFLGQYLTQLFFQDETTYLEFLTGSLPWRFVSGILYYSLIILFYYMILYYNNLQERIKHEAELNGLVQQAELKSLKAQINPHFIFNSLNSISSLTITNPEKAQEMVIKLSQFLRYAIGQDGNQKNSLEDELKNIDRYLDIEKIRFGDRLSFEKQTSYDCLQKELPNLILQPLFENCIKHGVHESMDQINIKINTYCENNTLFVTVGNNYDPESIVSKGEGIGLKNIKERLILSYHRDDLIRIEKSEDYFEVKISVPQI